MGLSIRAQQWLRQEAIAREQRHLTAWEQAKEAKRQWQAEMLTAGITAEMLGISTRTLRRWVADGRIHCIKLGEEDQSPIRFRRKDIEAFKAGLRNASPTQQHRRLPGK